MSDELTRLHRFVADLAKRERALAWSQAAVRSLAIAAAAVLGGCWAMWRDVDHATATVWITLLAGSALWFAVAAPLQRTTRAASVRRQAELVERLRPALRGRLLTVVGRPDGPIGSESPAILGLAARRAQAAIDDLDAEAVHSSRPTRQWAAGAALLWLTVVASLTWGPVGAPGVWQWWFGSQSAQAAAMLADVTGAGVQAHVGDVTLRYIYPDYTGLEPYEVANSTGEAHAPPGTRVEVVARSAESVQAASLVAYDQPALDAVVTDGREIAASFMVGAESGSYVLLTQIDGEVRTSRPFPIVVERDLAPEVSLESDRDVVEIAVDAFIDFDWMARDDYGVARAALMIGDKVQPTALRVARGRSPELSAVLHKRPRDLGMYPGETHEISIVAWDNDTVSGSKMGQSNVVKIVVLGEDGVARMTRDKRVELLSLLIDVLADHLEESFPPGELAGDYARWGGVVAARYEPLAAFVDAHRGRRATGPEWEPVDDALTDGRTLVRYSQVSFLPGSRERANDVSIEAVASFHAQCIDSIEVAALHIDGLLRAFAVGELAAAANDSAREAEQIRNTLNRDDVDAGLLTAGAEAVRGLVDGMAVAASDLGAGGLRDFVNSRTGEVGSILDEVRGRLDKGELDQAKRLMSRVTERLDELARGIKEELERQDEKAKKQGKEADDLRKLLEELAARQDALAEQTQSIEEQGGAAHRADIAALWLAVEEAGGVVVDGVAAYRKGLDDPRRTDVFGPGFVFNETETAGQAADEAQRALDSAVARDLAGMVDKVGDLQRTISLMGHHYLRFSSARGRAPGPDMGDIERLERGVIALYDAMEQLRRRSRTGDPALRDLVRAADRPQRTLRDDLTDARADAKRAVQEMPVTPRGLEEALEQADVRMSQAIDQIGEGDGMQAQGSQQAAAQHIRDAIDKLKDAQAQGAAQAQERRAGAGQGEEGEDKAQGGEEDSESPSDINAGEIEMPGPEEFQTPEAYRSALLRGMEGDVPEEYRALKRRYYEELVHQ